MVGRKCMCGKSLVPDAARSAICYVPVHDNYMLNKQALASKSKPNGGQQAELLASEIFLSMTRRCELLRELVEQEGPEAEADPDAVCHVLDYELQHGTELLGCLCLSAGQRLAAVFGVDNLAGMASWNNPAELLDKTDLVLISRQAESIQLSQDPSALLSALRSFQVDAQVAIKKSVKADCGQLFTNENSAASGVASLFLLPALAGPDEALSSTRIRESVPSPEAPEVLWVKVL
ncbi:hypothetical protein AK812_SmicGene8966 [Symbiodinium microadriaticum]|uniref:Uncharacterized protein n=1 Tax=Symbiodinium microadriaticum TaxID=2951 RepID=A0A1Q9EJL5_SYMMI|nr:hypothetical protein AK812_SmicGene8966 [Symbiodinium microadriaticum]